MRRPACRQEAVLRFFIVLVVISVLYLVYGVHAAQFHDDDLDKSRLCAPSPCISALSQSPQAPSSPCVRRRGRRCSVTRLGCQCRRWACLVKLRVHGMCEQSLNTQLCRRPPPW